MGVKKPVLYSKTIWAALLYAALVAFEPTISKLNQENPTVFSSIVAMIFIWLRIITTKPVI
jgi:hypothetical protein